MPLFEFSCNQCHQPFEELVRSSSGWEGLACPSCGSTEIVKKVSTFASKITSSGGSIRLSPSALCSTGST